MRGAPLACAKTVTCELAQACVSASTTRSGGPKVAGKKNSAIYLAMRTYK